MFTFSRTLKHGKQLARTARQILHRKKDLLSTADIAMYEAGIAKLDAALKAKDKKLVEQEGKNLDDLFGKIAPARDGVADWLESLLVSAIVIAAFRAYCLQAFVIPTGSMQPTLNGLIVHRMAATEPLPALPVRWVEWALLGHSYVDQVAERDDRVVGMRETSYGGFLARTTVEWESGARTVLSTPMRQAMEGFGISKGRRYRAGEIVARGYVQAGDQVMVNRMVYHFRRPERGEVFVFKTEGIGGIGGGQAELMNNPNRGEHYIKRLAGVPGDTLRIASPRLFVNGAEAKEPGLKRVVASEAPYAGYGNLLSANLLRTTSDTYDCGPTDYFALGDNSYNSSDSRFWGPVPEPNLLGTGYFVYWPFGPHWGWIR